MPLSRAMPRIVVGLGAIAIFACAGVSAWSQSSTARIPRELVRGGVDMVIQRVEPAVLQTEILAAVQSQIDRETMCFGWPSIWLEPTDRRRQFIVRFDLMTRDWGADATNAARARMQEFVDMGLLTARARSDIAVDAVEFRTTPSGNDYLRGSAASGRLSFCMPAHRRVEAIVSTQFGDFACGTLQVRFRHVADSWPVWARTDAAQRRVTEAWGAFGAAEEGTVSMSRQWFAEAPHDGQENGGLRSLCLDPVDRVVRGDDLQLLTAPE